MRTVNQYIIIKVGRGRTKNLLGIGDTPGVVSAITIQSFSLSVALAFKLLPSEAAPKGVFTVPGGASFKYMNQSATS
jgi:hypothetical protein